MKQNQFTGAMGLRLSRQARQVLKDRGIFAHSPVTLQHQQLANRYVLRGLESGGAVGDVGRYVSFAGAHGQAIEYLHPVEAIGVNGIHAVVVASTLVRIDMVRKERTYELLITQHGSRQVDNGQRPQLETKILFRGIHGRLELDLSGKDKAKAGAVMPTFYSLAGEEIALPKRFIQAIRAVTKAVNCIGCSHCHYVSAPRKNTVPNSITPRTTSGPPAQSLEVAEHVAGPAIPTSPKVLSEATAIAESA